MHSPFILSLCLLAIAPTAGAATMSASPTAPLVDSKDLANEGTATWRDKWWTGSENAARPHGQTLSIGDEAVMLNAVTYVSDTTAEPDKTYVVRVGIVDTSTNTFTEIHSETATQSFRWNPSEYMTWTLDEPVYLAPNQVYGVDVGMTSSSTGWQTGIPYLLGTEDTYSGGTSYLAGLAGPGMGDNTVGPQSKDRIFHLDMDDPLAPTPYDGQVVPSGIVPLSWTNLQPNVGADVWVDVWFGTDPDGDFTKVVDAGLGTSSVLVQAPVADTYYWRVDSYLDGSATGTPSPSAIFSFVVTDTDGDGIPDAFEHAHTDPPSGTALEPDDDLDADGLTNLEEYFEGTDPTAEDTDGDALRDGDEVAGAGARPATNPLEADTDGDGLDDGVESNTGTFAGAFDRGTDPTNDDTDHDALRDGVESGTGTFVSALDAGTNPLLSDSDGDGSGDWYELAATFTDPTDASDDPGFDYPLADPDGQPGATDRPVKVYILSGQSNMVGIGYVNDPLDGSPGSLSNITRVGGKFPNLVDAADDWTVRNDVWYEGVISASAKQWLTAGCGADSGKLGPELGFGHILGEFHDEPVLLIKSSIGNRSLGWDYAPPGTPSFTWNDGTTDWTYAGYGDSPARWETGSTPTPINWYAGKQFDDAFLDESDFAQPTTTNVDNVVDVLDNFATRFPQFADQGFEIAGYVWWQGHKDQYEPMASRYEQNMVHLIETLRSTYETRYPDHTEPDAPFVLGTIGFEGWDNTSPTFLDIANGQLAVSGETGTYPQFAGNVLTVETRSYFRPVEESPGSQGFHYNNNAETYMLVGDALGRGMVNLLTDNVAGQDTDAPTPNPAQFTAAPTAINSVSVTMTAATGSDATDPVQYRFVETSGNPGATSSGWQTSPTYTDTGLEPSTTYTYAVTMRDAAATPNVGMASAALSVTTAGPDTEAPTPNPASFALLPSPSSGTAASMEAVVGVDATGPVEYFFTETSGNPGGTDSGWQTSPSYTDQGLAPSTTYTYTVTLRDSLGNVGSPSPAAAVSTDDEASPGADATALATALGALQDHITGTAPLTGPEIAAHKATFDARSGFLGSHSTAISAAFDLVRTYDTTVGAHFVAGSPVQSFARSQTSNDDIDWVVFTVMQSILDNVYTADNIRTYDYLFEGFAFGTADFFPGHADPPADPAALYTVSIDASYADTFGDDTMYTLSPARRPTGAYVAPGATATVTVPESIVGRGYTIRVGAHSWDFSNKPTVQRLDRVSRVYAIDDTEVEVASPLGGGLYIEVPHLQTVGIIEVGIRNAIRAPYFSAKDFHSTTLAEWEIERAHPAPWADFQSEKFMMNVPTDWIYALQDPVTLMADHDRAMDAIDKLMGYPLGQSKETMYPQVDLFLRASVFAPGYPSVNMRYNPDTDYGGNLDTFLLRSPEHAPDWYYHEEGHAYGFPKFGGETEAAVNLLHVAVAHGAFDVDLDEAFAASRGFQGNPNRTLDGTAIAWMTSFNFSPRNVPMASGEKSYQLKGHAKFVDLARLFGWEVLEDYWYTFNEDHENGVASDTSNDGMILRLSESAGVDIRPLLQFWGIHPSDPTALDTAFMNAGLGESAAIYDTLAHYRSIVPADNAAFQTWALGWWGGQPNPNGFWTESEHGRQWDDTPWFEENNNTQQRPNGEIYVETSADEIRAQIDTLLALYFPNGRPGGSEDVEPPTPNPAGFAMAPSADSHTAITMTALTGTDASGPVEYLFTETTGQPGGTSSGWQTSQTYTDGDLDPATTYAYTVTLRDAVGNMGAASTAVSATTPDAPDPCDLDPTAQGCEPVCVLVTSDFPAPILEHAGTGSSSVTVNLGSARDVSFALSDLDAMLGGRRTGRYVDDVTVHYTDSKGDLVLVGSYNGVDHPQAQVAIGDAVQAVRVTLADGYDGDAPALSIGLGSLDYCLDPCDDADGDGICDGVDQCPGFDDAFDADGDGLPDGCDACTDQQDTFPASVLSSSGAKTMTSVSLSGTDVTFDILGIDARTNGRTDRRFIDEVEVVYIESGVSTSHATYLGTEDGPVQVVLPGVVDEVFVVLRDAYDDDSPVEIELSTIRSCAVAP